MKIYGTYELSARTMESSQLRGLQKEIEEELKKRAALSGPDMDSEWYTMKMLDGVIQTTCYFKRVTGCSLLEAKRYIDSLTGFMDNE